MDIPILAPLFKGFNAKIYKYMIKYVIFDIDGVVLDSERISYELCHKINDEYHIGLTEDAIFSIFGVRRDKQKEVMDKAMHGVPFDYDTFRSHFLKEREEYQRTHPIEIKAGFIDLANYLHSHNIKMACASSTLKETQIRNLTNAGIIDYFDYHVYGDEVKNSKPDPEIFLTALNKCGCDKSETFVVEDSINGVKAGNAAGIRVIHVPDVVKIDEDTKKLCYKIVPSLDKIIDIIEEENKWKNL